jgi:hypothetical protein
MNVRAHSATLGTTSGPSLGSCGSRACPAANALHEKHFRRVRRDVEPLVAGLAENVPADTDARFVVETMGVAIRALFGVERDHDAHTVRMILRDIFDHSESNTQIVQPQRATNQKSESQKATSSRFIVGCLLMLVWPRRVAAVLMAYWNTRARSCDCTPMIWF